MRLPEDQEAVRRLENSAGNFKSKNSGYTHGDLWESGEKQAKLNHLNNSHKLREDLPSFLLIFNSKS